MSERVSRYRSGTSLCRSEKSLLIPHHKSEWNIYDKYGYFPFDIISEESVSRTLENCYDDYCAAQLAAKLGKTEDYNFLLNAPDIGKIFLMKKTSW